MAKYKVTYELGWAILETVIEAPADIDYLEVEGIANDLVWEQLGFGLERAANDIGIEEL